MDINKFKVKQIIEKMKMITGAKSDKELSRMWGVQYSTIDNWKQNGNIPEKRLISFCTKFGTDISYLIENGANNGLLPQNVYLQLAENDMVRVIESKFRSVGPEDKVRTYNKVVRLLDEVVENSKE